MLIRAPWFIYELPFVNTPYNQETITDCFDTVEYQLSQCVLHVQPGYNAAYENGVLKYTVEAIVKGFGNTIQVLTLVEQEAGLYRELPIPAHGDVGRVWLLLTAFSDDDGKTFNNWAEGSSNSGSVVNTFLEDHGGILVEFCQQVAAKLTQSHSK